MNKKDEEKIWHRRMLRTESRPEVIKETKIECIDKDDYVYYLESLILNLEKQLEYLQQKDSHYGYKFPENLYGRVQQQYSPGQASAQEQPPSAAVASFTAADFSWDELTSTPPVQRPIGRRG